MSSEQPLSGTLPPLPPLHLRGGADAGWSDADLEAALTASAAAHSNSSTAWHIDSLFEARRSGVSLTSCSHRARSDGRILQVGCFNQFHRDFAPLIRRYGTASAICGYTAVAVAEEVAAWPSMIRNADDLAALQQHLRTSPHVMQRVEQAMHDVRESRLEWLAAHPLAIPVERDRAAYVRDWVANFEVSDLLRRRSAAAAAASSELSARVAFVRFNQHSQLAHAKGEERERLADEEPFSGRSDASAFLVELFSPSGGRRLLRPSEALNERAGTSLAAAVLDLNGHFAVAIPLRGDAEAARPTCVLLNTTDFNYLSGSGAFTTALAFDLFFGAAASGAQASDASAPSDAAGSVPPGVLLPLHAHPIAIDTSGSRPGSRCCDVCGAIIGAGADAGRSGYHCAAGCDFDVCAACFDETAAFSGRSPPLSPRQLAPAGPEQPGWNCDACTFFNECFASTCEVCSTPKAGALS